MKCGQCGLVETEGKCSICEKPSCNECASLLAQFGAGGNCADCGKYACKDCSVLCASCIRPRCKTCWTPPPDYKCEQCS